TRVQIGVIAVVVTIKFCYRDDFSATKTVRLIQRTYGDAALSRIIIFEWYKRESRESVKDDQCNGRLMSSRIDDKIGTVDKMAKDDKKNVLD
ncbi:Putative uncharacterized protein FLJ37770, partial [Harpegnathos saltator]